MVTFVIEAYEGRAAFRRTMGKGDLQLIEPVILHRVEPQAGMEMQVHFFDQRPDL